MSSSIVAIIIISALLFLAFVFLVVRQLGNGVSDDPATHEQKTSDVESSKSVIARINAARSITLKKVFVPVVSEEWNVLIDGEHVGKITGLLVHVLGNTFSLHSDEGHLIGSVEAKASILPTDQASVYDYNNENIGALKQEILLMLYKVSILRNGSPIGRAEQNFDITMDVSIKNENDEEDWHIRSAIFSMVPEIHITRVSSNPFVSGVEAIWTAFFINKVIQQKHQHDNNHQIGGSFQLFNS